MMARCVWVLLFVLLTISIPKAAGVRVLVLRDNGESRSEEETSDIISNEESEEIDFLLDLIKNEARERKPPPVTTVRVVKRKPEAQLVAQHSVRKENFETHPKAFKEYHVHYHNHQHKEPINPMMAFEENNFRPVIWDSPLPHEDFDAFKEMQKPSFLPYSESARVKSFRDFETFLKTNLRSPYQFSETPDSRENGGTSKNFETVIKTKISNPKSKDSSPRSPYPSGERYEYDVRGEAFKDFETIIKPKLSSYRSRNTTPFQRIKKFQDFMDSEEDKSEFLNKDRFAGFKDFSEIESPPDPKPETEEKSNSESGDKKGVKIRDFAIVIKSKPRKSSHSKVNQDIKQTTKSEKANPGPQIPPFVNKLRIPPNDKPFFVPRVLHAAGGAPKHIDNMNQMKYPNPDNFNMPYRNPFHLNALENDNRFFHLGPPPVHPFSNFPVRNPMNGWLLRRFMR